MLLLPFGKKRLQNEIQSGDETANIGVLILRLYQMIRMDSHRVHWEKIRTLVHCEFQTCEGSKKHFNVSF